jgi:hypothetical protein
VNTTVALPWWIKRIRHGSLFHKRLNAYLAVILAGLCWFIGDVYDLWLSRCQRLENAVYTHWWTRLGELLGVISAPDKPVITPMLMWLDLVGDIGFFITFGYAVLWIYCDSYCLALERCEDSSSCTPTRHREVLYRYFFRHLLTAVLVAILTYQVLWIVFRSTGLETKLRTAGSVAPASTVRVIPVPVPIPTTVSPPRVKDYIR